MREGEGKGKGEGEGEAEAEAEAEAVAEHAQVGAKHTLSRVIASPS